MNMGRCAGCGYTHVSCKKVRNHTISCPKYIALFKSNRLACLDPTDEYDRFKREEGGDDAKAEAKEDRLSKRFAELDTRRLEQVGRWKPRDLLDD